MAWLAIVLMASVSVASPTPILDRYVPGQVVVQLTPDCRGIVPACNRMGELSSAGIAEIDRLNAAWQVKRISKIIRDPHPNGLAQKYGLDLYYLLNSDPATDVPAMMAAYQECPKISYVGPNVMMPLDEVPNDPRYPSQWHLLKIQAAGAWDISHGDTNVRIGVVDDGADYYHPDIIRNIWFNGPEDINHNHRMDPYPEAQGGDFNDYDDDGNGYVDDVCGYDFVNNDPDPLPVPPDDHGTHCWGVTNAVTNNDTGVASIAWHCAGLILKAGQGGYVMMAAAVAAIYYAVEKGAWVTSHSYGSTSPYNPERDAMQYAVDAGGIVCCAAGNSGIQSPHYPGAYDMVVGVAASDAADHRASWSNYGTWVEVASPGTGILSTVPDSNYTAMDGTSMATPLVAGLCALIKAGSPGITNAACLSRLYASCDTMPDPDFRAGLLGAGRINAMKALAMTARCYLTFAGSHLNDPNHNSTPEPGEVCGLTVTLANASGWQTATAVSCTLTCDDPDITITKNVATFPNIPGGSSGNCAADSLVFAVNSGAVPHRVVFRIAKGATPVNMAPSDNVTFQIGLPRILLVDDHAGGSITRWYREACDSLRVLYDRFVVDTAGVPSSDTLRLYPVVVWYSGLDSTNLLSPGCRSAIQSYLDNGGNLFICGPNIGQAFSSSPFYSDYLKAQLDTTSTGSLFTLGLVGDPIGDGDTIVCGGAGGAGNAKSLDGIKPIGGALGSIIYRDFPDTTVYGAIHYAGGYKLVYFAEPFEAIDHAAARYVQKWTILRRILTFFGERLPGALSEETATPAQLSRGGLAHLLLISPSPATDRALISYSISPTEAVRVRIYDTRGRLVRAIAAGVRTGELAHPGRYDAAWDLRDVNGQQVANGVYVCHVSAGPDSRTGKLLVMR